MACLFWFCLIVILYSYAGYTLLLMLVNGTMKIFVKKTKAKLQNFEPRVSLIIAAYNEKELIAEKVANLRALDYPTDKITFVWVTDGSNDGSPELLHQFPDMHVLHQDARNGKIGAINRAMKLIDSPIVIFCDANNFLAPQSIKAIVAPFANEKVGCVAGEKQIQKLKTDKAAGSGEGIYWNYESYIKKLESEVHSTVGAAGELFAIRRNLFEETEPDTLLDDFVISLRIAQKGYYIKYAPQAIAIESGSASTAEELKRKVRIAAGSLQTLPRLAKLLNPFKYGFFSIQYWSHKVLRWTLVPVCMFLLLPLTIFLVFMANETFFTIFMWLQLAFYLIAFAGYLLRSKTIPFRFLFIPYYLVFMNIALLLGFKKYVSGKQSVNWEKARRS